MGIPPSLHRVIYNSIPLPALPSSPSLWTSLPTHPPPSQRTLAPSPSKSTRPQSPGLRFDNTLPQQPLASQASRRLFSLETLVATVGHSEPRASSYRPASVLKNQGPFGILGYIRLHAVANSRYLYCQARCSATIPTHCRQSNK